MSIKKRGYFLFSLTMVAGLYSSVFAMDNESTSEQKEPPSNTLLLKTLDWVHIDDMTDSQKEKLSSSSCGAYIDPQRQDKDATIKMEAAPLLVYSEDSEAPSESTVTLRGDVQISQGNREVRADKAQVNNDTRQVSFQGNVQFREPGLLLVGDQANIDIDNRNVTMNNVTYVIHEASLRGTAKKLDRTDQGTIIINESSYSTCEPSDSSWQLVTKQ
ncbi:MAG: LPS-assembly protein LptD, partial [Porticoccaceae bacterium]|nr:LPS-assembly protein LptD [Porticoccaceae bacterium]